MAKINTGPAALCDLACEVHVKCQVAESDMYRIAYTELLTLVKAKRIYRHQCGAFMLPPSTKFEEKPKEPAMTLRPGTVIPKKFRHLIPSMPNPGKEL